MHRFRKPTFLLSFFLTLTWHSASAQASEELYCPEGFNFDRAAKLCTKEASQEQEAQALGPFPKAMIKDCIKYGSTENACKSLLWNFNYARALRGTDDCPTGAQAKNGTCLEGDEVFGPFPKRYVARCLERKGGEACRSLRWHETVYKSVADLPNKPSPGEASLKVPYFYQYLNSYEPESTCGITSASMLLRFFGKSTVTPDGLYLEGLKELGQSPEGLAKIYRLYGLYARSTRTGSLAQIKKQLDADRPVVLHGYFTGSGHVLLIRGYNAQGLLVNDPAGNWYRCLGCGYPYESSGQNLLYRFSEITGDVIGYTGDIWFSVADTEPFEL